MLLGLTPMAIRIYLVLPAQWSWLLYCAVIYPMTAWGISIPSRGWLTVNVAEPYIKDGSLKPIVIGSYQRFPKLPDTPTMEESGFSDAGFEVSADLMARMLSPDRYRTKICSLDYRTTSVT